MYPASGIRTHASTSVGDARNRRVGTAIRSKVSRPIANIESGQPTGRPPGPTLRTGVCEKERKEKRTISTRAHCQMPPQQKVFRSRPDRASPSPPKFMSHQSVHRSHSTFWRCTTGLEAVLGQTSTVFDGRQWKSHPVTCRQGRFGGCRPRQAHDFEGPALAAPS